MVCKKSKAIWKPGKKNFSYTLLIMPKPDLRRVVGTDDYKSMLWDEEVMQDVLHCSFFFNTLTFLSWTSFVSQFLSIYIMIKNWWFIIKWIGKTLVSLWGRNGDLNLVFWTFELTSKPKHSLSLKWWIRRPLLKSTRTFPPRLIIF